MDRDANHDAKSRSDIDVAVAYQSLVRSFVLCPALKRALFAPTRADLPVPSPQGELSTTLAPLRNPSADNGDHHRAMFLG